jgi:putative dimethyl sulfoxide reductase chaperone
MNNEYRLYIYAFLSRVMSDIPDRRFINDLKNNESLLEIIGEETKEWILSNDIEDCRRQLNIDYTSMYILNTQPVESFVLDAKNETLVGLAKPGYGVLFYPWV